LSFTRADDLLGAWRLDSAVEVFDDGQRRDEFGPCRVPKYGLVL
jgi:hypothetical protein